MRAAPLIAVLALALDQVTKLLVLDHLDPLQGIEVLPFFDLVLVWNRGVSFGMLTAAGHASPWILVGIAGVILAALVFWLRRERQPLARLGLWLVLAGALGNIVDRVRFGAVVDFLDFHVAGYHWPAFNIADSAIVIGVGLLLIDSLFLRRPLAETRVDETRGETDARA